MKERIIKFRAWDEQWKIMHYDFEFIRSGIEGNDWIVFKSDRQPLDGKPHPFENPFSVPQLKLMEFAGVKDNKRKDVYESDIMQDKSGEKFIVEFGPGTIHMRRVGERDKGKSKHGCYHIGGEIIGNIFENPELLK